MKEIKGKKTKTDNLGKEKIEIDKEGPKTSCNDRKCPFHGNIKARGMVFVGDVIRADLHRTATIEFKRQVFLPKYERKEVRFSRIKSHNPQCINAKVGDKVRIMETRPLSKTKNFVIMGVMGVK